MVNTRRLFLFLFLVVILGSQVVGPAFAMGDRRD
jgi:hypothetical protein